MKTAVRSRTGAYAVAVGLTLLALVLTLLLGNFIERATFILFFAAVILSAWAGGLGPGLVATALIALAATYSSFQSPALFTAGGWDDFLLLGLFVLVAGLISSLQAARQRAEEWFRVTLTSIGDAVVVTDLDGRVVLMNPEAERLTGWSQAEARQRDLVEVFQIVNEYTRQTVDNPVTAVLRQGAKVGLAQHTLLLAEDGAERPIDDSAAPIHDRHGRLRGVVLVFRDITERSRRSRRLSAVRSAFAWPSRPGGWGPGTGTCSRGNSGGPQPWKPFMDWPLGHSPAPSKPIWPMCIRTISPMCGRP